ncbi:phage tail tube protein [Rhizobium sp. SYY.PMSO]|uniref:phage tail tube protein n=1 Tax=Rhizobium sp. SYY.PMSO TaxID=3382192 RepID=UPI00398F9A01
MADEFQDGQEWGRTLLIKIGDGNSPEVFSNFCGLKTRSFTLSADRVDTTTPNCANPGGKVVQTSRPGVQSVSFTGAGKAINGATMATFRGYVRNNEPFNAQVVVPGDGIYEAQWTVTNFELSGDETNTMEFSATWNTVTDYTYEAETP